MTPKERILAAINHELPDRIPAYVNNLSLLSTEME